MQPEIQTLLNDLAAASVTVSNAAGELRIRAPKGALTFALKMRIDSHAAELLDALKARATDNDTVTTAPPFNAAEAARARVSDSPPAESTARAGVPALYDAASFPAPLVNALSPAARETLRRLDDGSVSPCCGQAFHLVGTERVCPSCKLCWPDEDMQALRGYLEKKRG